MNHTTRWSPDTCGCVIDYTWDAGTSEDERVHEFAERVYACPAHAHLDGRTGHAHVAHENLHKNVLHEHVTKLTPDASFDHDHRGSGAQRELVVTVDDPSIVHAARRRVDHADLAARLRTHGVDFDARLLPRVTAKGG